MFVSCCRLAAAGKWRVVAVVLEATARCAPIAGFHRSRLGVKVGVGRGISHWDLQQGLEAAGPAANG